MSPTRVPGAAWDGQVLWGLMQSSGSHPQEGRGPPGRLGASTAVTRRAMPLGARSQSWGKAARD